MLKKLLPALLIAVSTPLLAQDIVGYTTARVVSIDPITTTAYNTVPRTSCYSYEQRDNSGTVAGAIVGGIVGRNMAKDKDAGTIVGGVAGAIIGNNATQPQERCTTYHDRESYVKVVAYNVTFEYNGQLRTTRMNRDPGNYVNVKTVTRIFAYD
jgi:uncharacterized protein YcfJ